MPIYTIFKYFKYQFYYKKINNIRTIFLNIISFKTSQKTYNLYLKYYFNT